jgi:probable rRNA maturation factor
MLDRAVGLCGLDIGEDQEFNLIFAGDRAMARINRDFVGHEGTTDVITFNYLEGDELPGADETAVELVICPDVACREGASRRDSSYGRELALYVVHGILHCSGYDDLEPEARSKMRRAERRVMKALGAEFDFDEVFPS